ncbi:hypothetical protein [Solwaraspora sp. WMMA2065]|uniref:hypothetical protein n=1 Tax=Solwaraspora sp. WMMA2065 TaxID=3015166 RepID=UPI00259BCF38|nr:hypothetical protein [Solwaraspora sp. WMMA2065]WJK32725.1 hypothetical protein O7610_18505 [Solwaraspora sp. WMMA2065]
MTLHPDLPMYIRTLVRGENDLNDEIEARLDRDGWDGFPRFLASLFFIAVDRRFSEDAPAGEIIRFVAALREDLSHGGPDVDPTGAEALIRSVLDPAVDYDLTPEMVTKIQAATMYKIFSEGDLSDAELDEILAEATEFATQS